MAWKLVYAKSAFEKIRQAINSEHFFRSFDEYRTLLRLFPRSGIPYREPGGHPLPCPCRSLDIVGTPFILYYYIDKAAGVIVVLHLEDRETQR